jgi:hypothetical protein
MLNRILHLIHFLAQPEPSQHLGRLTGQGLANVKARKFFLFEDHRGDSFPEQEHGCGRATRAAANNEYVCFHDDEEELKGLCLISRTPRSDV